MNRYILLDRDGTVIHDRHYLKDPEEVELLPGAAEGLRKLRRIGYRLAILTNQSGVGRGYYTEDEVRACNRRLEELLRKEGVVIDATLHCPHAPEDNCDCRKPAPGLMYQAAEELGFDPEKAWMIGDKYADIRLGADTGATPVLVRTGKGAKEEARCSDLARYVVDNLKEAADRIAETD
ncbi:D-glycero-beta-D-manno-heptose 1,7-bisphosphate 7-phosphatase [Desulfovibrio oxyclinae]|uniref:D-glycero-beta-D-manno-heptose 1,7-bisphosphate 7-phosphatase n=1 Tax=Desulfovibrio oxyclinae TaxID=63560 RepID=UPI00037678FD|nr:D-glycero-beta-D-manno-heptose 1,7-bisphosphate 7-phosphatase [Desulfovibrio oxyclinae]